MIRFSGSQRYPPETARRGRQSQGQKQQPETNSHSSQRQPETSRDSNQRQAKIASVRSHIVFAAHEVYSVHRTPCETHPGLHGGLLGRALRKRLRPRQKRRRERGNKRMLLSYRQRQADTDLASQSKCSIGHHSPSTRYIIVRAFDLA